MSLGAVSLSQMGPIVGAVDLPLGPLFSLGFLVLFSGVCGGYVLGAEVERRRHEREVEAMRRDHGLQLHAATTTTARTMADTITTAATEAAQGVAQAVGEAMAVVMVGPDVTGGDDVQDDGGQDGGAEQLTLPWMEGWDGEVEVGIGVDPFDHSYPDTPSMDPADRTAPIAPGISPLDAILGGRDMSGETADFGHEGQG